MKNDFEEYLKDKHAEGYNGTDDDMPEAFDSWLSELDGEEYISYAEDWKFEADVEEKIAKELFNMVYQWGRIGMVVDHNAPAFKEKIIELRNYETTKT